VAGDVAWALRQRRANGKNRATIRLNLEWSTSAGVPECVTITGQGVSEVQSLMPNIEPGVIYVMDRGYVNFELMGRILHGCSDFVLRVKSNIGFTVLKDLPLSAADREAGVISDRIVRLDGSASN